MLNLLLDEIIRGIENVKGEEIQKMDLREIENTPCAFFVICSGNSNTQVSRHCELSSENRKQSTT